LFRGFDLGSVSGFERLARGICGELYGDYGDLPREGVEGQIYSSTPYPADKAILFHNESAQMDQWPQKQWFYCQTPAAEGGETPIADCRRVYRMLDPEVRNRFERDGVLYVRNFAEGFDVPWPEFFRTEDRAEVESICAGAHIELEWTPSGGLRTFKRGPGVLRHPKTGETVFFNQILAHHVSCLDDETRSSLLSLFGAPGLPRNVLFGDGSPIPDEMVDHVREVLERAAVVFPWQRGDVILLDNMLAAHSRNPFVGPRKILVAMGEMFRSPLA
jgi:alpha-ketoglutarate-dependent taurine dioxygenase